MSTSVGAIDLGLRLNKNDFAAELNDIGSFAAVRAKNAFAPVGKVLGSIIATGSIVAFTKSCVDLGSDLAEVQNVVDVTFGTMSNDINAFAKNAVKQFGLSETSAKQYSSTMGAMLKSMGFTTKSALEMSKSITGLSADMASFYNLDNQTAFEKIRSGISGETEPLKQLGINMSVANLEAYALANGISKAYEKMSQQEQALLRYNYLMSVTADAQGDFARTSSGWANRTRILKENLNSLKAELGQAFISVGTPVLETLNGIISKLGETTAAFRAFIDTITGNTQSRSEAAVSNIASAAASADKNISGIEKSAEKAKRALMGFDEINILDLDNGAGSSEDAFDTPAASAGAANTEVVQKSMSELGNKVNKVLDELKNKYNETAALFEKGFDIGIGGNYEDKLKDILNSIINIKSELSDIFKDQRVKSASDSLYKTLITSFGKTTGAYASMGGTMAQNFLGGWSKYLEQNKDFIRERILNIIGNTEDIASQAANYATAFAEVFDVIGGETGQQVTANIIGIFSNGFLGAMELGTRFGSDIFWAFTQPFIDNKDEIKLAAENTLKPLETITDALKTSVDDTFTSAKESYDAYIEPMFDNFEAGTSRMSDAFLDWYNEDMSPVMQDLADEWKKMYNDSVQPNIDKSIQIISKFGYALSLFWNNIAAPFAEWFREKFGKTIAGSFDESGRSIIGFSGDANKNLGIVLDIINKITDAVILLLESFGDFKNNWATGMDEIIDGLKSDKIKNTLKQMSSDVKSIAKDMINAVIDDINWLINKANEKIRFELPDFMGGGKFDGLSIPTIPKLAQGGIVKQPTLAMVGESGREAVIPLENNTGWINELADKLAGKLAVLIMSSAGTSSNDGNNTPIEIIIEIGGVRFGKVIVDSLNALKKQGGRLDLKI